MADLDFMESRLNVNVLRGVCAGDKSERSPNSAAALDRGTEAWDLAGLCDAHYVIDPRETRDYLIRLLEVYTGRQVGQYLLSNWPTTTWACSPALSRGTLFASHRAKT